MSFRTALAPIAAILIAAPMAAAQESSVSVLDHTMKKLGGDSVNLAEEYAGKVVLFVNVASRCGYTRQYEPLQTLHERYSDQGLAIVGVPCNQFGGQEPGSAAEITAFCETNYGVAFDLLEKVNVNEPNQAPLYADLTGQAEPAGPISWNFEKFLVGRDGSVVGRYKSRVEPLGDELIAAIEAELAK